MKATGSKLFLVIEIDSYYIGGGNTKLYYDYERSIYALFFNDILKEEYIDYDEAFKDLSKYEG